MANTTRTGPAGRRTPGPRSRSASSARRPPTPPRSRRSLLYTGGVAVVVIAVVAVFVVLKLTGTTRSSSSGQTAGVYGTVPADVLTAVTDVPASALDTAGIGTATIRRDLNITPPFHVTGSPLVIDGKPGIVYVGAEFCPFCAAERWALVAALSKFGTFHGLETMLSSPTDVYPSTPTFTFLHATYTSRYITFDPVEEENRNEQPLQRPSKLQESVFEHYDTPPYVPSQLSNITTGLSIPFVDLGNRYIVTGSGYSPGVIHPGGTYSPALSMGTIAGGLRLPSTSLGRSIDITTNYLIGAICQLTHDQPAAVCQLPAAKAASSFLSAERTDAYPTSGK